MISWFELPSVDLERAMAFYSKVFNHSFKIEDFEGFRHAVFLSSKENSIRGTIIEVKEIPTEGVGATLFFNVHDMSSTLSKIEQNGGRIVKQKTLIKNKNPEGKVIIAQTLIDNKTGYYAYFIDSEGNKMGLYSNS